jgi:hypothetical protein
MLKEKLNLQLDKRASLPEHKRKGFVKDGIIDIDKWRKQKLKILFYYKETYGYKKCEGTSISNHYKEWIEKNQSTNKKMALLADLLIETVKGRKIFEWDEKDLKEKYADYNLLVKSLSKTAIININKLSIAKNNTSDRLIRIKSRENKKILKAQIELIKPNIIICGGRVTSDSLYLDLNYLSKKNYEYEVAEIIDNQIIAPFQHLSSRTCWYEKMYNYYTQIAVLMKGLNI